MFLTTQIFMNSLSECSGSLSVNYTDSIQVSEDCVIQVFIQLSNGFINSTSEQIDLRSDGRRLASDCKAKLESAGFKKSTYKKSKKKVGVRSVKDGFLWYWTLPEVEKPIENGQEVTGKNDLPI